MIRINSVQVLDKFRVKLGLTNGKTKSIDLEPYLRGPIFEPLKKNINLFRSVKVDHELGTIVWDNGADIDPDVLIEDILPEWMETQTSYSQDSKQLAVHVSETKRTYSPKKKK